MLACAQQNARKGGDSTTKPRMRCDRKIAAESKELQKAAQNLLKPYFLLGYGFFVSLLTSPKNPVL